MSSFITGIIHDRAAKTLTVGIRGGSNYTYTDVPRKVFKDFMGADSKGKFYNSNIRNKYKGV